MRGSEKQIKWASEISENIIRTMESVIATIKSDPQYDPQNPVHIGNIAGCEAIIKAVKSCEYAGDIIDCFKDIHFKGDIYNDFGEIRAVYRVTVPTSKGQKKLLMK
jgi:hypothetical protein